MSDSVLENLVSGYMATEQPIYTFGWQGGEPTLMGLEFFTRVTELQQLYGRPGMHIANGLQTNATLIDDPLAAHLADWNFLVGVSLDGPQEVHDRFRVNRAGRGSHADVLRGLAALQRHGVEFNVLVLVSSANVGRAAEVYRYLRDMGICYHQYIPCVEFDAEGQLLPFAVKGEEWGDFLCGIYDEWHRYDSRRVSVRCFDSIMTLLTEGSYNVCHMGGSCRQYFVVEYNGDVYPCDFFVDRERLLGNIAENTWEEMQNSPLYREFGERKCVWNEACLACPYLAYCSGDCPRHRSCGESGNPGTSHLCSGWRRFFAHALPGLTEMARSLAPAGRRSVVGVGHPYRMLAAGMPGRNEACACGSGKKFKRCHGARLAGIN